MAEEQKHPTDQETISPSKGDSDDLSEKDLNNVSGGTLPKLGKV
jgi:bacteriocin-like protein